MNAGSQADGDHGPSHQSQSSSIEYKITFEKKIQATLSQSPGNQTKYFELSVVWDSQFVMSFTFYMYTDCIDHRDYNLHVHVFGNDILEFN